MKTCFYSLIFAVLLTGCYPSDVLQRIPDGDFQRYLAENFDNNGDHKVAKNESLAVTEMYLAYTFHGKNLEGIRYFENLEWFGSDSSDLQAIDLSKNKKLKKIELDHMRSLQMLKLNPEIEEIVVRYQSPQKIEVGPTPQLQTYINCYSGRLLALDIVEAPHLKWLNVKQNQITELDLKGFPELEQLYCDDNQLTTLDLSGNPNLKQVRVKGNPHLKELWLKKGQLIDGINENPDYKYCIDRQVEIKYKE